MECTQQELANTLNLVLITEQLPTFYDNFLRLVNDKKYEDLNRMFDLCNRVDKAMAHLMKDFETHIREECLAAIAKMAPVAINVSFFNSNFLSQIFYKKIKNSYH